MLVVCVVESDLTFGGMPGKGSFYTLTIKDFSLGLGLWGQGGISYHSGCYFESTTVLMYIMYMYLVFVYSFARCKFENSLHKLPHIPRQLQ